ncbi:Equilibrative nucleoside transporter 1 [Liparis tanakae]|uniref:Equilibrative nucleoside transporter 1 n=1 Tax=Liparis tanakae TaxID=230148 RepID=A0A4Z2FIM4_9TELE|nr:Equilibrative nucleoside transporter 1 [Liparis tanakae]
MVPPVLGVMGTSRSAGQRHDSGAVVLNIFSRASYVRMNGRTDAPQDRGCLVGICFFILGLGTLLPWNFFMTALLYFQSRLNTTEWSNGTATAPKEYYFNNWMTLLSQLPLLVFTLLNSFLYQRSVTGRGGSLFGLVGLLPQKFSAIFMSGQGLAGTFAAIAMLIAIASDADFDSAALGYFITPCVGTLVTLFSYLLLPRLAEVDPGPEEPKAAFLSLEQVEKGQAKASVMEVFKKPPKESRLFPLLVVSRLLFVPLLMFCNVQKRSFLPVLFSHDAAFAVIMMLFALSSGYFVCLSMSYAPQLVEQKDAETAGALMTFFLSLGLSIGAALSFPLRALV